MEFLNQVKNAMRLVVNLATYPTSAIRIASATITASASSLIEHVLIEQESSIMGMNAKGSFQKGRIHAVWDMMDSICVINAEVAKRTLQSHQAVAKKKVNAMTTISVAQST
jgi:hypothetical protein